MAGLPFFWAGIGRLSFSFGSIISAYRPVILDDVVELFLDGFF